MTGGRLTRAPAACRGTVAGPVAGPVAGALSVLLLAGCAPAADVEAEGADQPVPVTSTSAAGEPDDRCAAVLSDDVVSGSGLDRAPVRRWSRPDAASGAATARC